MAVGDNKPMSTEPSSTQPSDGEDSEGTIRAVTAVWLIASQIAVMGIGLRMIEGAGPLAGIILLLGLMTGRLGSSGELVSRYAAPVLLITLVGVIGSWTLWAKRRHGWAALVSSLSFLYVAYVF